MPLKGISHHSLLKLPLLESSEASCLSINEDISYRSLNSIGKDVPIA
jgi:hypothetical protein